MHAPEFDQFLEDLGRCLKLRPAQRTAIREELTDHFCAYIDDLMAEGMSREAATQRAVQEFGDAVDLAHRFGRIGRGRIWIMRSAIAASLVAVTSLVTTLLIPDTPQSVVAPPRAVAGQDRAPVADSAAAAIAPDSEPSGDRIEAILSARTTDFVFEKTSLREALERVAQRAGVNMYVNWKALDDQGISADMEVSLNLKGVSLLGGLELLLEQVGRDARLVWFTHAGILRITTENDAARATTVCMYDCHDLVARPLSEFERAALVRALEQLTSRPVERIQPFDKSTADSTPAPTGTAPNAPPAAESPDIVGARTMGAVEEIESILRAQRMTQLRRLIEETIDRDSWNDNGGNVGRIAIYQSTMAITQTPRRHAEIESLLKRLAESLPGSRARAPSGR